MKRGDLQVGVTRRLRGTFSRKYIRLYYPTRVTPHARREHVYVRACENAYSPLDVWCASGCLSIPTVIRFRTIYRGWMRAAWNINRKKKKKKKSQGLLVETRLASDSSSFVPASSPHRSRYRMRTEKPQRERAKKCPRTKRTTIDHRRCDRKYTNLFGATSHVPGKSCSYLSRAILHVCAFVCTSQSSFSMKICEGNKILAMLRDAVHARVNFSHGR